MAGTIYVYKQLGKGNNYREISETVRVVNTTGTDKNLFRLVPVLGHGALVLLLELVPVPGHGAQISTRAPTKGYVQTGARAKEMFESLVRTIFVAHLNQFSESCPSPSASSQRLLQR